jgi:hypothetical protein
MAKSVTEIVNIKEIKTIGLNGITAIIQNSGWADFQQGMVIDGRLCFEEIEFLLSEKILYIVDGSVFCVNDKYVRLE